VVEPLKVRLLVPLGVTLLPSVQVAQVKQEILLAEMVLTQFLIQSQQQVVVVAQTILPQDGRVVRVVAVLRLQLLVVRQALQRKVLLVVLGKHILALTTAEAEAVLGQLEPRGTHQVVKVV